MGSCIIQSERKETMKNIENRTYEKDFYAWSIETADLLRQKRFEEIDLENIAEEIESMGKSNKRALNSHLAVLMAHLLKWQFQPARRSKSWKLTIKHQRLQAKKLLEESPSLKYQIEGKISDAYEEAKIIAASETGMEENFFPLACPFTLDNCLNNDFFPE